MTLVKQHIHGIIGAVIFAIIAILLLLLLGFTTKLPLPPEEGILIDFGGGGNLDAGESASTTSNEQSASTQNSSNSGVNTQNFEDAASMQSSTNSNANTSTNTTGASNTESTETNQVNSNFTNIMNGNLFGDGNGTGTSGDGTGSGNPGDGTGTDGSGTGPGGYGGDIGGRGLVKQVNPPNQDNLEGTVKLKFLVDEDGNVSNVTIVSSNCPQCTQLAINAVKQWKYEKKPGTGTQTGTVTVNFQL